MRGWTAGKVAGTLAGAAGVGAAATAGLAVGLAGGAAYGLARGTGWVLENTLFRPQQGSEDAAVQDVRESGNFQDDGAKRVGVCFATNTDLELWTEGVIDNMPQAQ